MGYDLEGKTINGTDDDYVDDWEDESWENPENQDVDGGCLDFSIVTSNAAEAKGSIGNRVWVIQGEAHTKPREYYLHGYFFPETYQIKPTTIARRKFKYRLCGGSDKMVLPIQQAERLNGYFWFISFRKHYKNFRVGFREITDSTFISELEDIYEKIKF